MERTLPLERDLALVEGRVPYQPLSPVTLDALKKLGSLEEIFRLGELMGMRRAYLRQSVNPWTSEVYCKQYTDVIANSVSFDPTRVHEIADSIEAVVDELKIPHEKIATIDFSWCVGEMVFRKKSAFGGLVVWETTNPVEAEFNKLKELLELNVGPDVHKLPTSVKLDKFRKVNQPVDIWEPVLVMNEVASLKFDSESEKFFASDVCKQENISFKSAIVLTTSLDVTVLLKMALPDMFIG